MIFLVCNVFIAQVGGATLSDDMIDINIRDIILYIIPIINFSIR